jgi:transposase-like protein
MKAEPLTSQFAALFARNGADKHPQETVSGLSEEPKATGTDPKNGGDPVAPTQRAKASRRRYSLEDKRRILRLVDACTQRGQIGAILRREGIYYTTLRLFLQQRENGQLDRPAKATKTTKDQEKEALAKQVAQLQRQNQRLQDKLEKAEIVIDFQKKLSRLLEIEVQQNPDNS